MTIESAKPADYWDACMRALDAVSAASPTPLGADARVEIDDALKDPARLDECADMLEDWRSRLGIGDATLSPIEEWLTYVDPACKAKITNR